jgi:hypothetical protein
VLAGLCLHPLPSAAISGTSFILRIKEEETRLILHEHNDDDDGDVKFISFTKQYLGD